MVLLRAAQTIIVLYCAAFFCFLAAYVAGYGVMIGGEWIGGKWESENRPVRRASCYPNPRRRTIAEADGSFLAITTERIASLVWSFIWLNFSVSRLLWALWGDLRYCCICSAIFISYTCTLRCFLVFFFQRQKNISHRA